MLFHFFTILTCVRHEVSETWMVERTLALFQFQQTSVKSGALPRVRRSWLSAEKAMEATSLVAHCDRCEERSEAQRGREVALAVD